MSQKTDISVTKIVLTGGPSAGKTTALSRIYKEFNKKGYIVVEVPETASELIIGGITPVTCENNVEFQKNLFKLQIAKEKIYTEAAMGLTVPESVEIKDDADNIDNKNKSVTKKVLVIFDRGLLDNKAYMSDDEFDKVLSEVGISEVDARDSYDAVFHMVTAAKGAESAYTTENNAARTETKEQAAALDDALISAWTGHPHLRVIDNSTDFETKIERVVKEIANFLGEPEPHEIERKYLIKKPDIEMLNALPNCQKVEIIQTYLMSNKDEEVRVRQRGANGNYVYFKTLKRKVNDFERIEIEERISEEVYLKSLMDADPSCKPIRKDRYCIISDNQYFELDVYPFWDDKAIVEIELDSLDKAVVFPKWLEELVIKEVTDDNEYKNYSIAKRI